jgi:hypothetical protein
MEQRLLKKLEKKSTWRGLEQCFAPATSNCFALWRWQPQAGLRGGSCEAAVQVVLASNGLSERYLVASRF